MTEETRTNKRTARGIPPKIPLVISITRCLARNLEVDKKTKKCYRLCDMSARDEVYVYISNLYQPITDDTFDSVNEGDTK